MNNENLSISYNKLWKLLIDRGMKKKDLQQASGVSAASIAKLVGMVMLRLRYY